MLEAIFFGAMSVFKFICLCMAVLTTIMTAILIQLYWEHRK